MGRSWVLLLLLWPTVASAQLTPGAHYLLPSAGATFATNNLLEVTTLYPPLRPTDDPLFVETVTGLDPGLYLSARYMYALTRRLAFEAEFGWGVAVHVIEQTPLDPEATGTPQIETTVSDAQIVRGFANLSYFLGPFGGLSPFVTAGFGSHKIDLRQKGDADPDPVYDTALMLGIGIMAISSESLSFRLEIRDFMYDFYYDNQFADERSDGILDLRDIGIAVRDGEPRFQHDITVTFGIQVKISS